MGCSSSSQAQSGACFEARFELGDKLAEGSYGIVHTAVERDTGIEHVVKVVSSETSIQRARIARETYVWTQVGHHSHVVALQSVFSSRRSSFFVMERCQHTLLDLLMLVEKNFREGTLMNSFHQILLALHHCHSKFIAHRDVAPSNILVDDNGTVKLCDFGSAVVMPLDGRKGTAGTTAFMSPEMVKGERYDCKTDIWSCGASAYFLFYGNYLYQADLRSDSRKNSFKQTVKRAIAFGDKPCQPDLKPHSLESGPRQKMKNAIASGMPRPSFTAATGFPQSSACARKFVQSLCNRDIAQRPDARECISLVAAGAKFHKIFSIASRDDGSRKSVPASETQECDSDIDDKASKASTRASSRQSSIQSKVVAFESPESPRSLISL